MIDNTHKKAPTLLADEARWERRRLRPRPDGGRWLWRGGLVMLLLVIWGVRYLTMSDSERVTQVARDYYAALLAQNYSAVYALYDEATIHLTPERDCIAGAQRFDERQGVVRNCDVLADSAVLLPNTGQAQAVITVRVTRTAPSSLQVFLINDSHNIRLPDSIGL